MGKCTNITPSVFRKFLQMCVMKNCVGFKYFCTEANPYQLFIKFLYNIYFNAVRRTWIEKSHTFFWDWTKFIKCMVKLGGKDDDISHALWKAYWENVPNISEIYKCMACFKKGKTCCCNHLHILREGHPWLLRGTAQQHSLCNFDWIITTFPLLVPKL